MSPTTTKQEIYRQEKRDWLKKIIGSYCPNPDWIWIGEHSRRKAILQIDGKNCLGFFAPRTHKVVDIDQDLSSKNLLEKEIIALIAKLKIFLKNQEQNFFTKAAITRFDNGLDLVFTTKKTPDFSQTKKLIEFAKSQNLNLSYKTTGEARPIFLTRKNQIFYPNFKIDLPSDIFIQATSDGLSSIVEKIRNFVGSGEQKVIDLYSGFGAYSFAICDLIKKIHAVEGSQAMIDAINANAAANGLSGKITSELRDLFSNPVEAKELKAFDLAIINPPRNGASPQVLEISKSQLKNLIYVSCNPESFVRDTKILIDSGFQIFELTALDQFYATKHLELIAIFKKTK